MFKNNRICVAQAHEKAELESLQLRASLTGAAYRQHLLANPGVIEIPLHQFERGHVLGVKQGAAYVGFAAIELNGDGSTELDGLFVEPSCWRQGIATTLIGAVEQLALCSGNSQISVTANPNAVDFYLKVGFVKSGSSQTQFGPADRMVLTLD